MSELRLINNVNGENISNTNLTEGINDVDFFSESEKTAIEKLERCNDSSEPEIIITYGKVPEFETEEQMWNWLNVEQGAIVKSLRNETAQYFHPEGPVIAIGNNADDYFEVAIYRNLTIEETLLDEIYRIFDKEAKNRGINDVPVVFVLSDLPQLDILILPNNDDSNDDVLQHDEDTNKDIQSPNETPSKIIPGFGILSGLISLFSGRLLKR